jgi:putative ABC transport system ATP-binding protein
VSEHLIETLDLSKSYYIRGIKITAVDNISLQFPRGEFTAIMGPSGSGKTTLLNLITGLERPSSGKILFEGKDITNVSERDLTRLRREKIGFVFQMYNLIPVLTTLENVELPTIATGLPKDEARQKALDLLERVGLKDRLYNRPVELSGGEQQRVAIARALINAPSIFVADEPTGHVDTETGLRLIELMSELNQERAVTIILTTHDQVVADHADRIIRIRDGRILDQTDDTKLMSTSDSL